MITKQDFWDRMQYLKVDSDGFVTERSEENVAEKQYELSKQLAIDFMDWKMTRFLEEEDGVFFDQMGEVFAETSEELFNLYLKSQK